MKKATEFEILRGIQPSSRTFIPMDRKPVRVALLLDDAAFASSNLLIHHKTVFLDDYLHDWDWRDGKFSYYSHAVGVDEACDVVVVYQQEDVEIHRPKE